MQRGTILYHREFQFFNGDQAPKLLVILNTPDLGRNEPYLVCRTTSNPENKTRTSGCQYRQSLFFIEANKDWFDHDTWLQLYDIYEFSAKKFLQLKFRGLLEVRGILKDQRIREIVNCIKKLKDISGYHKDLIVKKRRKKP